ncbi:hypothetical protein [Prauserella cavernicola]|uniref:Uncharacterized protein n=1 Tax=Prauserella cavernicola TaxID=2800127 RepID=A0A934QUW2_9PSEU|nr:hypothetical protein [Prauserella cavernicola]MBK1786692.1 hypothetical protein [Prauserella cavernicola]
MTTMSGVPAAADTADTAADGTPRAVTCEAKNLGTIEVYPPAMNADGTFTGVARVTGDGGHEFGVEVNEDVQFGVDPIITTVGGVNDGVSILISGRLPKAGKYYTGVRYEDSGYCQSQSVQLP